MKDAKGHGSNPRGGSGEATVRIDTAGSPARKTGFLGSAKQEFIAKARAMDESHYPSSTPAARKVALAGVTDRQAAAALSQGHPKSDVVPLGSSFAAAEKALERGRSVAMPRGADNRRTS